MKYFLLKENIYIIYNKKNAIARVAKLYIKTKMNPVNYK